MYKLKGQMRKVSVALPENMHSIMKLYAAEKGLTLTEAVIKLLIDSLSREGELGLSDSNIPLTLQEIREIYLGRHILKKP